MEDRFINPLHSSIFSLTQPHFVHKDKIISRLTLFFNIFFQYYVIFCHFLRLKFGQNGFFRYF